MNNKFIEKPYQKFLEIKQKKDHFKETFPLTETQAQTLLIKLKKYCYLISHKDTKFFDIEETFYDSNDQRYYRQIQLNRPKTLQIKTQKIHLTESKENNLLIINFKSFHKHKQLQIPLTKQTKDWQINSILQQNNLSFPLLKPTQTISFTRVFLYQPHSNTKIYIDLDIFSEDTQTPEAQVTIISSTRKNFLAKSIKKHSANN